MTKNFITKDMKIREIVNMYPDTIGVFFDYGLHCIGCMAAQYETVEQGAVAHGIDVDKLVKDLNEMVNKTTISKNEVNKIQKQKKSKKEPSKFYSCNPFHR